MSKRQVILLIYKYFLSKLGESYHHQDRDSDIITNFLLQVHLKYNLRCIDSRYFFRFIANQFEYRSSSRSYSKYSVANIFGKSSIQRYFEDTKKNELAYIDDKFLIDNGIKYTDLFKTSSQPLQISNSLDRKRFHNTPAGYLFCIETTTLYDRSCKECMICKFKKSCKELKSREQQLLVS